MRYPRPVARLARAASLSFCLLSAAAAIVSHGAPRPILGSDAQPSIEHPRARAEAGALPAQQHRSTKVEIVAVYPEGQMPDQGDEGLRIENTGDLPASMAGWTLDDGEGRAAFPEGTTLDPGRGWWIAAEPKAFASVFGHAPDWAWRPSSAGAARNLVTIGAGPRLADRGDEIVLRNAEGTAVDALVYRSGSLKGSRDEGAWKGPGLEPYHPGSIRGSHQVFLRKRDPSTGRWIGNGDSSAGWRSDPLDARLGRRAVYPGWDLEHRPRPLRHLTDAEVEVAVAPDALLPFLLRHFRDARSSIDLQVYTFESPWVAEALAERARDGVRVRVLVEGSPAGGLDLNERFALHEIHRAGGSVYFMDRGGDVAPRYRGMHAKLGLIDERRVLIGSENPNPGAAPADDPRDGTAGRRGVFLAIQAAPAAAWARAIIRDDLDPTRHRDIRPTTT